MATCRQTRSFCYIDDLVEALMRMDSDTEVSGPINIGNPVERRLASWPKTSKRWLVVNRRSLITHCQMTRSSDARISPARRRLSTGRRRLIWRPG